MKKALILAMALVMLAGFTAYAQQTVPPLISYQGMLTDASGSPMTGTKKLTFNIYDAAAGGNLIWGPQVFDGVPLIGGRFSVILGTTVDTAGRSITGAFSSVPRYLGITVDTNPEIAPRQQILSTPFAVKALHGVPAGTVLPYGGISVPEGFLECNGNTVSRTTYANLFAAVGTSWGKGDGSTTFHLPDLRGRFLRGVDGNSGRDTDSALRTESNSGGNKGNNVGSVQGDDFKSHNHSVTYNQDILTRSSTDRTLVQGNGSAKWGKDAIKISDSGGKETRPKNAYVKYIIKY